MIRQARRTQPDRSNPMFESDVLTQFLFYSVYRQKAHHLPEERLALAILTDAIECFQRYRGAKGRKRQRLFKHAELWILSNDASYPFSFVNICQALDIAPSYLRMGLFQWRASEKEDQPNRKRIRETLRYQNRVIHRQIVN